MWSFREEEDKIPDILSSAEDVFLKEGFNDVTFQKIADHIKTKRTSLYRYFNDKLEIFHYVIRHFMYEIEKKINAIRDDGSLRPLEKIYNIMEEILAYMEKKRSMIFVIRNFIVNVHKNEGEMHYHIRRRTIRFKHILSGILIDGIEERSVKPVRIGIVNETLFEFIEAAILEISIFRRKDVKLLRGSISLYLELLAA